jgi:hypothetical protein
VRSFWNQPGFCKLTPDQLNKAIAITQLISVNNKYEDPKSGRTVFHNTRKVITSAKEKTKRKIFLYYVSSDDRKERPEFSPKTEFWQNIWDNPCRQRKIEANCSFGTRTGPRRIQSAQGEYQNTIVINGREPKRATRKGKVSKMLSKLDKNKTNVTMNKRREDIPPRLLGYFPYNHLWKRVNVNELKKELDCHGVKNWAICDGLTKGLKMLKTVEKKRFEETVEKAMMDRGKTFVGLSISEKLTRPNDTMKTNEESTNGEFDVASASSSKDKQQTLM